MMMTLSTMLRPDLLFTKAGQPVVVVEAKARPVSREFEIPVRQQLKRFSVSTGSPWALLVDPKDTWLFHSRDMEHPVTRLSTEDFLGEAFPARPHGTRPQAIGEQVLLLAVNRLVPQLQTRRDFLRRHPELQEFAREVADSEATSAP